ncbi:MAG TPA: ABC transporter permease [Candidatus Wallbacteria bacterium]|nr:MAG: FtsX-like permease family protein [bacterium ADurb.Bin243]HOD40892.1 ABC transporter permease [Candidatus Wallbacteria bacterium]HPG56375.1 ABC transporter permease [Candidatus Wallbacteria bacterium]
MKIILKIIFKSLRQHMHSSALAVLSIAVSIAMLTAVISLREQTQSNFTRIGHGIDGVLGPKGSPLQIVLNAVYHIEETPGKIKWEYYKKVKQDPIVEIAVPFCSGHSYAGFRVNAIEEEFFSGFEYQPGKIFSFKESDGGAGRVFKENDEAVAGYEAAKALKLKLGSVFNPVCGVNAGDPVHNDVIKITGIMAPTGTPHDRAIYIPLKAFYTLSGHGGEVNAMALDEKYREISGAYIKIRRIRNGIMHPGVQDLKYNVNQSQSAQFVVPNEVLPRLFNIIGWIDSVLFIIAAAIAVMSALFLFSTLLGSINQRKRDIALIRFLGAPRRAVLGMVIGESLMISMAGLLAGLAAGHTVVYAAAIYINCETGVVFSASYVSCNEFFLVPAVISIAFLTSLVPAFNAYKIDIIKGLSHVS